MKEGKGNWQTVHFKVLYRALFRKELTHEGHQHAKDRYHWYQRIFRADRS